MHRQRRSPPQRGVLPFSDRLVDWGFPRTIIEDFAQHHTILSFQKSEIVFSRGAKSEFLGWVKSGTLKIVYHDTNGLSAVRRLVGPGEVFGHQSILAPDDRLVHGFDVRAHSDCQVVFISV